MNYRCIYMTVFCVLFHNCLSLTRLKKNIYPYNFLHVNRKNKPHIDIDIPSTIKVEPCRDSSKKSCYQVCCERGQVMWGPGEGPSSLS
jgi:hypothetical protein